VNPQYDRATVLVVVRDPALSASFTYLLEAAGLHVVQAASPMAARSLLVQDQPDLMLLDMDWGPDWVCALTNAAATQAGRGCAVAVVVGWWDARAGEATRHGDALVYKPPTERQVLAVVEQLLHRHLALGPAK
jgi:DNA-binding response OmpR family regulator